MVMSAPATRATSPAESAHSELWTNAMLMPLFGSDITAYAFGSNVTPSVTAFAPEATTIGQGYGQRGESISGPGIVYPITIPDTSALTFVAWIVPDYPDSHNIAGGYGLAGCSSSNADGYRIFTPVTYTSGFGSAVRWRVPQAAGNVDDNASGEWSAGDLLQVVCLLGGGTQTIRIYNATTDVEIVNVSKSTASTIDFSDGQITLGNINGGTNSFPGTLVYGYQQNARWTDQQIVDNRVDPFQPWRMGSAPTTVEYGTAYRSRILVPVSSAWKARVENQRAAAWQSSIVDTRGIAYRASAERTAATSYRALTERDRATAYRAITEIQRATAYQSQQQAAAAVAWAAQHRDEQSLAWQALAETAVDSAWRALESGETTVAIAWRAFAARAYDSAYASLNESQKATAYRAFHETEQTTGWQALNAGEIQVPIAWRAFGESRNETAYLAFAEQSQATAFQSLTAAEQDMAYAALVESTRETEWHTLAEAAQVIAYKSVTESDYETAWRAGLLDLTPVVVIRATQRRFVVPVPSRTFTVSARAH